MNVLRFEVCGTLCALPIADVREVLPMAALSRPPLRPSLIEGFLEIAGQVIPVLRLDMALGLTATTLTSASHLIWLKSTPLILMVDRVQSVITVEAASLKPVAEHQTFNACVTGQLRLDAETVHVLSPSKLLLQQERRAVEEFALLEQKKLLGTERTSA